jgi:hypothetical protein
MNYRTMSILALLAASAAQATTYYAASNGAADADCLTPQTAGTLDLAVSKATANGDIVQLAAGDYDRSATPVTLSVAGITLKGASDDATQTVLIGPGTAKSMTGIVVTKKATVRDLTIRNFYLTGKGGAAVAGANGTATAASNLTAINCRIENNRASSSGTNARYNRAAPVYGGTWSNCVFVGNSNTVGNGGAADSGTYYNCVFTNNTAQYYGGALYLGTANKCLFIKNSTTASGCCAGAVYGGTSRNCTFIENSSLQGGAAAAVASDKGYFYNCTFRHNTATSKGVGGGALAGKDNSSITATNCVFESNIVAKGDGTGGAARYGGYTDCVFSGNTTGNSGQGGALEAGIATRCLFVGNSARHGSGTHNTTANFCIYSNNVSLTTYDGTGVALYQGKALNCLIVNNRTTRQNTGIIKGAVLVNCTIVGNTVKTASYAAATDGTYTNCLFMSNTMDIAGGTHVHSLYNTKTGSPTLMGCLQKSDAKFNAGANASLPYYALRGKSPAKDAGIDAGWTAASLDLLGKKRLVGTVDIGCYEYSPGGFRLFVQ